MKIILKKYINKNTNDFQISNESNATYVCISALMKFLMNIVRLLEQQTTMTLQDIKTTLDCTISTTFEYGYPNLLSILTAYDDIFKINIGVTQERSEVTLLTNSESKYIHRYSISI